MSSRSALSAGAIQHEAHVLQRLAVLFSEPNPPYVLNGGAAINLIFAGGARRVPTDIDLRCDDLEATRRVFERRYLPVKKPATVKLHCFVDENGVEMDLTQNRFGGSKRDHTASGGGLSTPVKSYDFETLFAEKLLALTRKRDAKDLVDAHACLGIPFDRGCLLRIIHGVGKGDRIDLSALARSSFLLDATTSQGHVAATISADEMLPELQRFVAGLMKSG